MPKFKFIAKNNNGQEISGNLEAQDKESALKLIAEKDLIITSLEPLKNSWKNLLFNSHRIKGEELLLFTQQLASMLNAGINIKKALDIMIADIDNNYLRQIVIEISLDLSSGNSLSESLAKYPKVFSRLYMSMVKAGEASGKLPGLLLNLSEYIEKTENLKKRVMASLYYPATVMTFAVFMLAFLFTFGIPRLSGLYKDLGGELPLLTRMFISIGDFMSHTWIYWLVIFIIGIAFLKKYFNSSTGRFKLDSWKLSFFLIGPLFKRLAIARFSHTLSVLYASGVPIHQAMDVLTGSMDNLVMEKVVTDSMKSLEKGETITDPLRRSNIFTTMAISMIAVGEETGTLDSMLTRLSDFYEIQVDITLKSLTELIEPLIMIGVGLIIATIIIAMALPFMQISTIMK